MKLRLILVLIFLLAIRNISAASPYVFDYNERCQAAYQQFMALNLEEGRAIILQEMKHNPYNLMATYLADYEDCLLLLMNGDVRDYEQRSSHLDERLKLLSLGDLNTPWYRLCKASLYFHWALVHIRFAAHLKAATIFRKSFLLLKENQKLFPQFAQNKIFMGVEEAVVGTIPDDYKWLASIFGMKGNVKKGISQINSFIRNSEKNEPLREEAIIYATYLQFYLLSQQQEVWTFINSNEFPVQDNLLRSFVKANLALNFRKGETALRVLKDAQANKNYQRYPILDYEMGSALLHRMDDNAVYYLNNFLRRYNGRFFIKDAWQKIACSYYLQQDIAKANRARAQILSKGTKQADADKQAQRFAETKAWPVLPILQAGLLTDGGYYTQALQKIQTCDINKLDLGDKLEYNFRLARIYDELGNSYKALQYYQTTINIGRERKEHYAARSALQMGMLYERSGKTADAINKFRECLAMKNHDFQSNIDQQAKAGVNRLTQK